MLELLHIGQWQGFYIFGPAYGEIVNGKEAEFRMFIEEYHEGQFTGRVIDWDGFGAGGEVSQLKGFIKGRFISFTKQYSENYIIDPLGNKRVDESSPGYEVVYEGQYDPANQCFYGSREIRFDKGMEVHFSVEEISGTGTWRMASPQ